MCYLSRRELAGRVHSLPQGSTTHPNCSDIFRGNLKNQLYARFVNHARVNQDELGTIEKCKLRVEELIKEEKSVVIDNTNCKKGAREFWISVAKEMDVSIRAVLIEVDADLCKHLNQFRLLNAHATLVERNRKSLALDWNFVLGPQFKEYLQADLLTEGFTGGVASIQFTAVSFGDPQSDRLLRQFLVAE